jgi:magnesium transporter
MISDAAAPQTVNYPEHTIGSLMEPPVAVFPPHLTVAGAVEHIRELAHQRPFTYGYIVDHDGKLLGVVTMRDLLLHEKAERLETFMLRNPFSLRPEAPLMEAMRQTVNRHYPSYPVTDAAGVLVGIARGAKIFEQQAIEVSAQPGTMVGVEREERIATPFARSLRFRHPWLQFNLLTGFIAAAVVGVFEGMIEQVVVLAVFLPVMMGQASNTGCQALAVALRGLTLGELGLARGMRQILRKEGALGLANGALTGLTAGAGMFFYATWQNTPVAPVQLAMVVFVAMTLCCFLSGICGVLVPMTLKRCGADPATASSIFLTTFTDVASMGFFLGLACLLLA